MYLQADDMQKEAYESIRQIENALEHDKEGRIAIYLDMQVGSVVNRIIVERGMLSMTTVDAFFTKCDLLKDGIYKSFSAVQEGNTLLIISGHGTGILSPLFDKVEQKWVYEADEGHSPAKNYCGERTAQFGKTVEHLMLGKSILTARTGSSFLSVYELNDLISYASSLLGRKLDMLAFDSCYMAMLEVAYQVKDSVKYLVASQDCEEKDGWEYKRVIEALASDSVVRVGKHLLYSYEKAQLSKGHDRYSLSLLDLSALDSFADHFDALIKKMVTNENLLRTLCSARMVLHPVTGLHFYVDLKEFLEVLFSHLMDKPITYEVESLMSEILNVREQLGFLIDASVVGFGCRALHGCSIYFPLAHIDRSYTGYFVRDRLWINFLRYFTTGTSTDDLFAETARGYLYR